MKTDWLSEWERREHKIIDNQTELTNSPKTISGIDSLYYFYETNDIYDDLFLDILNQLEESKGRFEKRDVKYENRDIQILINNQAFYYNGKAQGFYWFTHIDEYYKIGFKDYMKNVGLNDIQIQLSAVGIYMLGIKALIKLIDETIAKYITGHKPLTRVDLNIFVQSDLSWINKDMFVARKRRYTTISKEVASKHKLQTLYIGKKPFLLRIYDKKEELKRSKKKTLMEAYFTVFGLDFEDEIFNVEFEMHRDYFKTFKIDTVDDILSRAEILFQDCLQAIRLVDLSSITDNTINSKNKNRATTHPLWTHLHENYFLHGFLSVDSPLERIKRKSYRYTIEEAMKEQIELARKAYIHNLVVDEQFYDEVLQGFLKSIRPTYEKDTIVDKQGIEIIYEDVNANINPRELEDVELQKYILKLNQDMDSSPDLDMHVLIKKYEMAYLELKTRGLNNPIEYPFLGWCDMNVNFEYLELIPKLFDEIKTLKEAQSNGKRWLTVLELSKYIGYSKDRIHALSKSEFIEGKHFYKKGKLLFDRLEIDNWIMYNNALKIEPKDIVDNVLKDLL